MTAVAISWPVYRLTLRSLVDGRRILALAALALVPVLAAVIYAGADEDLDPRIFWARLVQRLIIPTVTAFIAVVIAAGSIGDEREDGTILYLASTPLSRIGLMATKVLAAWTASMVLLLPCTLISGWIALGDRLEPDMLVWPLLGVALSALGYCAASVLLAMVTRRPVVLGVLYILLWEGSIATFAASADRLSIAAYGRAIAVEGVVDVNAPDASALVAVIVLAAVTAAATWLAARRLTRTELP
ncbi:MAG: ABC transporter permease [Thermoleophilia bacterium]